MPQKQCYQPLLGTSGYKNIGATIRIGREIRCLPYVEFFFSVYMCPPGFYSILLYLVCPPVLFHAQYYSLVSSCVLICPLVIFFVFVCPALAFSVIVHLPHFYPFHMCHLLSSHLLLCLIVFLCVFFIHTQSLCVLI